MTDRKIYKPKPISGFPEWLPEYRSVEQAWMDHFRRVFESYGYTNIDTPAVEELGVLAAKGDVDKEIYVLERLHKDPSGEGKGGDARLALHFDQTVPMARYVAQHFADLNFPFKRYQMQKVWRGERPQLGRAREFYQCDIDVIGIDNLPLHFDAEMPAVLYECLAPMTADLGRIQIRVNNRKIILGLVSALNITDPSFITRTTDKMDKIGVEKTAQILRDEGGLPQTSVDAIMTLVPVKAKPNDMAAFNTIKAQNELMQQGLDELRFVLENLSHLPDHAVLADMSIIRGFDYYTGSVYEAKFLDIHEFTRSIGGGGRYADLAGQYINKNLPGVGISIGLTSIFEVLYHHNRIKPGRKCPTDVLVVLPSEERRADAAQTAQILRTPNAARPNGLNVELFHKPAKTGDQITYASKKGIPYVWFPPFQNGDTHRVKNLESGDQIDNVQPDRWIPVS